MPWMTHSREEQSLVGAFEDRGNVGSSIAQSSSLVLDTITHWWCIEGVEAIFIQGIQPKEQGKPTRSIYEKFKVIDDRLSCVLGLKDTMIHQVLEWLTEALGK